MTNAFHPTALGFAPDLRPLTPTTPNALPTGWLGPAGTSAGIDLFSYSGHPTVIAITPTGVVPGSVGQLLVRTPEFSLTPGTLYRFMVWYSNFGAIPGTKPDLVLVDVTASTNQNIAVGVTSPGIYTANIRPTGDRNRIAVLANNTTDTHVTGIGAIRVIPV